jgi:hypothetical protein
VSWIRKKIWRRFFWPPDFIDLAGQPHKIWRISTSARFYSTKNKI